MNFHRTLLQQSELFTSLKIFKRNKKEEEEKKNPFLYSIKIFGKV